MLLYKLIVRDSRTETPYFNVIVRDPKATLDWSALDPVLKRIFGSRQASGDWSGVFVKYKFDWDAKCPSSEGGPSLLIELSTK